MIKPHLDPSRTTPTGMLRYAIEFFAAGCVVDDKLGADSEYAPTPANYLIGHAIELTLKAYLLQQGMALEDIRKYPLGHSLTGCFEAAEQRGMHQHFQLTDDDRDVLRTLDHLYSSKQLEYIETGSKEVPVFGPLTDLGLRLVRGVAQAIEHGESLLSNTPAGKVLARFL
jgi:hypothetical protein